MLACIRKAQTIAIRCLGSPQAAILYGKVYALRRSPNKNCHSPFISEVVIQTAIELYKYIVLYRITLYDFTNIKINIKRCGILYLYTDLFLCEIVILRAQFNTDIDIEQANNSFIYPIPF